MTLWKQNKSNSIIVPSFNLICSHTISSFTAMLWQVTVFDLCRLGGWLVLKLMKTLNGLAFVRLWAVGLKRKWCLRQSPEKILQLNLKSISKEILRRLRVSNDLTSESSLWVVKKRNLPGYLLWSVWLDSHPLGWEGGSRAIGLERLGLQGSCPKFVSPLAPTEPSLPWTKEWGKMKQWQEQMKNDAGEDKTRSMGYIRLFRT